MIVSLTGYVGTVGDCVSTVKAEAPRPCIRYGFPLIGGILTNLPTRDLFVDPLDMVRL